MSTTGAGGAAEWGVPVSLPTPYYDRNGITIYCGDALDILPGLRAASVDLAVTDPPYVIGAVSAGNIGAKAGGWADMMNSARWFRDWYAMAQRLIKPTGAMWSFCNWRSLPVVMKAGVDANWGVSSVLVWDKKWIGPGGLVGLRPSYELVALFAQSEFAIPDRGIPDIKRVQWSAHKPTGHPAEKPVSLMRWLIETSGIPRGSLVIDPFMGSGTTLRAAADLGMRAIGIDGEMSWCDVAVERLRQTVLPLEVAS